MTRTKRPTRRLFALCTLLTIVLAWFGAFTSRAAAQGPPPSSTSAPASPLGPAGGVAPIGGNGPDLGTGTGTGTGTHKPPGSGSGSGGDGEDAGALPRSRGPAVRERGGRRSRASSAVSGVLFLLIIVGAMGYWVLRRLRR